MKDAAIHKLGGKRVGLRHIPLCGSQGFFPEFAIGDKWSFVDCKRCLKMRPNPKEKK